jgi:purine-binding chemotaxis protein CheW
MIDWTTVKQRLRDSESATGGASTGAPEALAAVLRERARRLAARKPASAAAEAAAAVPVLVFRLGREAYAVDLRRVAQGMPLANCTPVPGAPAALLGVINLSGAICSVVDLASLLGLAEGDRGVGHVMLVRRGGHVIGFRVDRFEKIERIANESLRRTSRDGGPSSAAHVRGVTAEGVIVLDVSSLLSHPLFASEIIQREQESPC